MRGLDGEDARGAVEDRSLTAPQLDRRRPQAYDGWKIERTREDRDVRRPRPGVRRDGDDRLPVQLHR